MTRIEEAWMTSVAPSDSRFRRGPEGPVKNRVINLGYDGAYRLTREEILPEDGPTEVSVYTYDDASNRISRSGRDTGDTVYSYNALNQLTDLHRNARRKATRAQVSYTYDHNGSRPSAPKAPRSRTCIPTTERTASFLWAKPGRKRSPCP